MKARDTVMNFMRMEEIDAKNATSNFTDALVDVAREQAEMSFKAGIKEVLDAIHYEPNANAFYVNPDEWQSKLKEWRIE